MLSIDRVLSSGCGCLNLVRPWLLEVPLGCFLVAPDRTPRAIDRVKIWVSRHAHALEVRGLTALLIVKGSVGLIS